MVASGRLEQTERTMFQLLLQQITVVLEVPKIEFKIRLTFFLKDSEFWYFSCLCEVTSKVVQGLSRALFYSKNKQFLLTHFRPIFHSYAPRK